MEGLNLSLKLGQEPELLSMALNGSPISKAVLGKLMPLLWYGLVDQAIDYLRNLPKDQIKNEEKLEQLIVYLDKNRVMIPVNWLRVLCAAEMPNIDHGIGHQFHPIVPMLDVLKPHQ